MSEGAAGCGGAPAVPPLPEENGPGNVSLPQWRLGHWGRESRCVANRVQTFHGSNTAAEEDNFMIYVA